MNQFHHDAILSTLKAIDLIASDQDSFGTQISTSTSDVEAATTYTLCLKNLNGEETIVAAKVFDTPIAREKAWEPLNHSGTIQQISSLRPVAGNSSSHEAMIYNDGQWILAAFRECRMLSDTDPLPKPKLVLTGLAGYSRVYFFSLKAGGVNRFSIVKFDTMERLAAESEKIEAIRKRGNVPQEFVLPNPVQNPNVGVILYSAFHEAATYGQVIQLAEFLCRQVVQSPANVRAAFEMLFSALFRFYAGGRIENRFGQWSEVEENSKNWLTQLPEILSEHLPESKEWAHTDLTLTALGPVPGLHNPFRNLAHRLESSPGPLLYSWVHGDLQSTNVLVALGDGDAPERVAVIDVEKVAEDRPVVSDLARIEADFWRSVFTCIAPAELRPAFPNARDLDGAVLQALVCALDMLDGRPQRWPTVHPAVATLAAAVGQCVYDLRTRAWGILHYSTATTWYPKPYFHALLFYYAKAVLRPLVYKHPIRLQTVVLAAALTEETLRDMDAGRYSKELSFPNSWPSLNAFKPVPLPLEEPKVVGIKYVPFRTLDQILADKALPKLLKKAVMFVNEIERSTKLGKIGITDPGNFIIPGEKSTPFIERLLQDLSEKNLLDETNKLLNLLPEHDVRPENFPELRQMMEDCERLLEERKVGRARSTFPSADR